MCLAFWSGEKLGLCCAPFSNSKANTKPSYPTPINSTVPDACRCRVPDSASFNRAILQQQLGRFDCPSDAGWTERHSGGGLCLCASLQRGEKKKTKERLDQAGVPAVGRGWLLAVVTDAIRQPPSFSFSLQHDIAANRFTPSDRIIKSHRRASRQYHFGAFVIA